MFDSNASLVLYWFDRFFGFKLLRYLMWFIWVVNIDFSHFFRWNDLLYVVNHTVFDLKILNEKLTFWNEKKSFKKEKKLFAFFHSTNHYAFTGFYNKNVDFFSFFQLLIFLLFIDGKSRKKQKTDSFLLFSFLFMFRCRNEDTIKSKADCFAPSIWLIDDLKV